MKKTIGVLILAAAVMLVVQAAGWGDVPPFMRIQGKLSGPSGLITRTGVVFKIWPQMWDPATSIYVDVAGLIAPVPLSPVNVTNGLFDLTVPLIGGGGKTWITDRKIQIKIYYNDGTTDQDLGYQELATVPFASSARALTAVNPTTTYASTGGSLVWTGTEFKRWNNITLSWDNVSGITLPTYVPGDVSGAAFMIRNTNTTSASAAAIIGAGGYNGGTGVWGIQQGAVKGIGVLGQSLADVSVTGKPYQAIGVYGASDGVGVFGGGPTIAWSTTLGTLTSESANIGVAGWGRTYGMVAYSTKGAGLVASTTYAGGVGSLSYAPSLGNWSISNSPNGGIGILGNAMANWNSATPTLKRSIGVYGGSNYIGVFGGGTYTWSGTSDIVTKEASNIGVLGAGAVTGVAGISTVNTGVTGVGPVIGVMGAGKIGVTGVGYYDGGVGVAGYHSDNPYSFGSLGTYWLTSTSDKVASAVTGISYNGASIILPKPRMAQGALGTYYATDKIAGVYGRVEDGYFGAGVVGKGGNLSSGGYFTGSSASPALHVVSDYSTPYAGLFEGELRVTGWGTSAINYQGEHSNYFTHSSTGTSYFRVRTYNGSAYTTVFDINRYGIIFINPTYDHVGSGSNLLIGSDGQLWRMASSRRFKDNIRPLDDNFSKVLSLTPKAFNWKSTGKEDIGLIAEEVDESGLKNLVMYNDQGQPDSVKYDKIALYLLQVVKEQQARIKALEDKVR